MHQNNATMSKNLQQNILTTIDLVFSNYPHREVSTVHSYWYNHYIVYTVIDVCKMF